LTIYYPEEAKSCTLEIILFKNAQSKIEKPRNAAFCYSLHNFYTKNSKNMSYL
jgi:hypothetical protein